MRCVGWGDARRCVSAGENVEFFRGARPRGVRRQMCVSGRRGAESGGAPTQELIAREGVAPDTRSAAAQQGQPRPSFLLIGPCAACDATALLVVASRVGVRLCDSPFLNYSPPNLRRTSGARRCRDSGCRASSCRRRSEIRVRSDPEASALPRNAVQASRNPTKPVRANICFF